MNSESATVNKLQLQTRVIWFYLGVACLIIPFFFPTYIAAFIFLAGFFIAPISGTLIILDKIRNQRDSKKIRFAIAIGLALILLAMKSGRKLILTYRLSQSSPLTERVDAGVDAIKSGMTRRNSFKLEGVAINKSTDMLCYRYEGWGLPGLIHTTAMISKDGEVFVKHDKDFSERWAKECADEKISILSREGGKVVLKSRE